VISQIGIPLFFGPVVFENSTVLSGVSNPTINILSKFIFQESDPLQIWKFLSGHIELDNRRSLLRLYDLNIADILKLSIHFGCSFMTIRGFIIGIDSLGCVQVPFRIPDCVIQNTGNGRVLLSELLKVLASSGIGGDLKLHGKTSESITITGKYTFELRGWDETTVVKEVCEGAQFTHLQLCDLHLDCYVVSHLETLSFRLHRCTFQKEWNGSLPLSKVLKVLSSSSRGTALKIQSYGACKHLIAVAEEYDILLSGLPGELVACIREIFKGADFPVKSLKLRNVWWLENDILMFLERSGISVVIESGTVMNNPQHIPFVDMAPILFGFCQRSFELAVSISEDETWIDGLLKLRGWHGAEIAEAFLVDNRNRVRLFRMNLTTTLINLVNNQVQVEECTIHRTQCSSISVLGLLIDRYSNADKLTVGVNNDCVCLESTDFSITLTGWNIVEVSDIFLSTIAKRNILLNFKLNGQHLSRRTLMGCIIPRLEFGFPKSKDIFIQVTSKSLFL
jgi:hypothetical protein